MAGDDDDQQAEDESFHHCDSDVVAVGEAFYVEVPVGTWNLKEVHADDIGGDDPKSDRLGDKQRNGNAHCEQARSNEEIDRVNSHGSEGINLLGDFHGSNFRRHGGANPAREHEAGDSGAQFPHHPDADDHAPHGLHIYEGKLEESLSGEHCSGEGPRDHHHGLRPISNFDDLFEKLAPALSALQERFADLSNETGQLSEVKEEPQDETTKQAEIDHAKV